MIMCIDCDNVLNNLQEVVIKIFNKRHSTNYTMDYFTDYNVENDLPLQNALLMKKLYAEPGLYDHVKPLQGAQNALQKLTDMGHQVYIVTDAIPDTYGEKVAWIKTFFPCIDESHIVAMKHKFLFKCDVMIEDNVDNLIARPWNERICFDYPWNRNVRDYVYDIYRVTNWEQVLEIINKLKME